MQTPSAVSWAEALDAYAATLDELQAAADADAWETWSGAAAPALPPIAGAPTPAQEARARELTLRGDELRERLSERMAAVVATLEGEGRKATAARAYLA